MLAGREESSIRVIEAWLVLMGQCDNLLNKCFGQQRCQVEDIFIRFNISQRLA